MNTTNKDALKLAAARAALKYVVPHQILGVGSGTTVNIFISLLKDMAREVPGAVAASEASAAGLRAVGITILDINAVQSLPVYIDGADEIDADFAMIKGGGAALTREKIIASTSDSFVCVVDKSKRVTRLGAFPLPIEVIPMAVRLVSRRLEVMGGAPTIRSGVTTDNGNLVLDVRGLSFANPIALETALNQLPGAVCNGVFALRSADVCITAGEAGVSIQNR
jgi:ribose 5-phosphate isomerase A